MSRSTWFCFSAWLKHFRANLDATKKAAELFAKRGVIEIWPETGMYRLKPKA